MRKMHITAKYAFFQMTFSKRKPHDRVVENASEVEGIVQLYDPKKKKAIQVNSECLEQK